MNKLKYYSSITHLSNNGNAIISFQLKLHQQLQQTSYPISLIEGRNRSSLNSYYSSTTSRNNQQQQQSSAKMPRYTIHIDPLTKSPFSHGTTTSSTSNSGWVHNIHPPNRHQSDRPGNISSTIKNKMMDHNKLGSPFVLSIPHSGNINMTQPSSPQFGPESRSFKVLEVDIDGHTMDQIIFKNTLSPEMKLQARDLRSIDSSFPAQMPAILARDKVFIISIGFIKAIVQYNKIILFDPQNTMVRNELVPSIKDYLGSQNNLFFSETLTLPFEFKVLEAILIYVCKKLTTEHQRICTLISKELDLLNENPEHNLENLLLYHKKGLNQFEVTIKEITDALDNLHQSDEDMALMYLTFRNATGGTRKKNQHEELEILLETYMRQLEQISNEISQLKETLSSTEEFVNFQLDTARNKMMRMNLMVSLVTMSAGMGSMVSGFFGMNLLNGFEHHPYSFYLVCACIVGGGLTTFGAIKRYCQVNNILPYTSTPKFQMKIGFSDDTKTYKNPLLSDFQSHTPGLQFLQQQQHKLIQDHLHPEVANANNNNNNANSLDQTNNNSINNPQHIRQRMGMFNRMRHLLWKVE